ncbi:hypothetical protein D3C75_1253900 [compost metagenome]
MPFYTRVLDQIVIDTLKIEHVEVDVGILPKTHKGLLGLDILKIYGFIGDMKELELYSTRPVK